ncbi:hypothetical protein AN958_05876 [Leucoagaricus sp. SymC.cos]|nr:hypothetical protein AN958_05876 [Leucoagaricus sp. SymC.cos]
MVLTILHIGIDILFDASAPDAAVDSEARQYAPVCLPGTREQYIHDITSWATTSADDTLLMYWMRGPAGVGKSAIAQTCAERVKESGQLGAAFFFSINGHNDPRRFFPTLAYQLSTVFPEYRRILNDKIYIDRTLIKKKMPAQFTSLIVEPLQELGKRGNGIRRRTIFIDGLDECQGNNAQTEIIEIIAASVRDQTTPFRWAIFSRPEPHIKTAFDRGYIFPLCQRVLLPISHEADGDIELYLKDGFRNILQRRGLPSLSNAWPTRGDIKILVEASAGLFAYPAAVLRFVDRHSLLGYEQTLQAVLDLVASRKAPSPKPFTPFAELDALYMLIMERIPEDTLPSVQLLLTHMFDDECGTGDNWYTAVICNTLGFSELEFRGICHQLHAVFEYQDCLKMLELDEGIDATRSFSEQDIQSSQYPRLRNQIFGIYGHLHLHHKSFYDFLVDPTCSSRYCVTTPAALENLFNHCVQRHHRFVQGLTICYSLPAKVSLSRSGVSVLLSWPHQSELVNSILQIFSFSAIDVNLTHDGRLLATFLDRIPSHCLQKLVALDYRKDLIAGIISHPTGLIWDDSSVIGQRASTKTLPGMMFDCIESHEFGSFGSETFLATVQQLEKLGVVKPYHPRLSSIFPSISRPFSKNKHVKRSGCYKLGHGDKAVYWYWEFDIEQKYFHQFRALDFTEAMKVYKKGKFTMWREEPDSDEEVDDSDVENTMSTSEPEPDLSSEVQGELVDLSLCVRMLSILVFSSART